MKLFVMRHGDAVSSKLEHGKLQADEARELSDRGRDEVVRMTEWLREHHPKIDLVIVSPYIRAQQTWKQVEAAIAAEVVEVSSEVTPESDAEAFAGALLARLQIEPAESVLVVSHMPFVCYLVSYLDTSVQPPLFPTAGIAVIDVEPLAMLGRLESLQAPTADIVAK
ncbi:phosphohistidine phosphatase SixA [Aliidiomarina halalkaliphila]|uniref:Phosphohistidine phosphatase SixA n=1 Tax=Aliidiomarina halalkaliphila TaxID=2593535 RepID=A0A552X395_9GAMM|nr:phosphohistidine phosphatase SixA [Aliidiomarina halalkaliphila]TRW49487.1 phosphohistidine phosphatase SixA [Aliidiomarina halalkaliphila]